VCLLPGVEPAAERGHPLPHADQAEPRSGRLSAGGLSAGARAVIINLNREDAGRVAQLDACARPARVTADVGECLLHDPVGRLVHVGRKRSFLAGHGHRHRQPGRTRPRDQSVQVTEPAAVGVILGTQHAERLPQLSGGTSSPRLRARCTATPA
jgi:hypothetical protein